MCNHFFESDHLINVIVFHKKGISVYINPSLAAPLDYSPRNSNRPCGLEVRGYFSRRIYHRYLCISLLEEKEKGEKEDSRKETESLLNHRRSFQAQAPSINPHILR